MNLTEFLVLGGAGAVALAALTFWIWMLVDCIQNESREGNDRLVWALVILIGQFLGALIYFAFRRPRRSSEVVTASRAGA